MIAIMMHYESHWIPPKDWMLVRFIRFRFSYSQAFSTYTYVCYSLWVHYTIGKSYGQQADDYLWKDFGHHKDVILNLYLSYFLRIRCEVSFITFLLLTFTILGQEINRTCNIGYHALLLYPVYQHKCCNSKMEITLETLPYYIMRKTYLQSYFLSRTYLWICHCPRIASGNHHKRGRLLGMLSLRINFVRVE